MLLVLASAVFLRSELRSYFTVSDLRLLFSSPPVTHRVMVEVLDPASTTVPSCNQSQSHIATDGQSVSLGVKPNLGLMTRYLLLFDSYILLLWGALSDERTGLSFARETCPQNCSIATAVALPPVYTAVA
jgi:hypothetical protein